MSNLELENKITDEINLVYARNRNNRFSVCDQRKFWEEIEDLEEFIRSTFMKKSEYRCLQDEQIKKLFNDN